MLLAIDIGNTNINLGIFNGKRLIKRYIIPTPAKNYAPALKKILARSSVDEAVVCSVVPRATKRLSRDLEALLGRRPYYIGKDIRVPIKNLYRKPRQVGQDRLVNAYAGVMLYGAPLIVVDFGTAITFDIISRQKAYLGGMILPGLGISLDSLSERTALLPKVKLERPKEFIGRDTKNSMLSGVVYGYAALCQEMIAQIKRKIGSRAGVVFTGGNCRLAVSYYQGSYFLDRDLTLRGLSLLFENIDASK